MSVRSTTRSYRTVALTAVVLVVLVLSSSALFVQPGGAAPGPGPVGSVNGSQAQASSPASGNVSITLDRQSVHARTGDVINITSTVHNTGTGSVGPVTAYLTLIDVKTGAPLDLEDWAATRAHQIPSLSPGHSTAQHWSVKAILGGTYRVVIVVVPKNSPSGAKPTTAVSPGLDITLTQRNNLNPGNVMPTVLGVPVGLLLVTGVLSQRRKRGRGRASDTNRSDGRRFGGDES